MSRVKLNILFILLLSRILSMLAFNTQFSPFWMTFLHPQFLLLMSREFVQCTLTSLSSGVVSFCLFLSCARSLVLFSIGSSR
jgi:hypothetical protein